MIKEINESSWNEVERIFPLYGLLSARRLQDGIDMLLALDHHGYRHILLGIEDLGQAVFDNQSRGITVQGRSLVIANEDERPFIDILCSEKDGHNVFNMVASDIFHKLISGIRPAEAVSTTLEKWRKFWGGASKNILSEEQIKGLFGELWFLLLWLLPQDVNYIDNWVGPTGARHDFEWLNMAVEVKTTTSIRGHIHRIHGLDQLDPPEDGDLYFFSLRIRQERTATNTLPLLIRRIETLLEPNLSLLELFELRLANAGYSPVHAEQYSEYRYRVVDERVYVVDNDFPRLSVDTLRGGIPNGVEKIDYDINLEVCRKNIVTSNPLNYKFTEDN